MSNRVAASTTYSPRRSRSGRTTNSVAAYTDYDERDDDVERARSYAASGSYAESELDSANGLPDPYDEWDYAERGPMARMQDAKKREKVADEERRRRGEVFDAGPTFGGNGVPPGDVTTANPAGIKSPRNTKHGARYSSGKAKAIARWHETIPHELDFVGPESYPRRFRDGWGVYIMCVLTALCLILGAVAIESGDDAYLWYLNNAQGALCGAGEGVGGSRYLWHPYDTSGSDRDAVCVEKCPTIGQQMCVGGGKGVVASGRRRFSRRRLLEEEADDDWTDDDDWTETTGPTRSLLAAAPPASDCAGGVWVEAALDYSAAFHACVPAKMAEQSQPASTRQATIDAAFKIASEPVNTLERFVSNVAIGDVLTARYAIVLGIVISFVVAYVLALVLEGDAFAFTIVSCVGGVAVTIFGGLCMCLAASPLASSEAVDDVAKNDVDARLTYGEHLDTAWPFLGAVLLLIAVFLVGVLFVKRKALHVAVLFLDQAAEILQNAELMMTIVATTTIPLVAVVSFFGTAFVYLSALASESMGTEYDENTAPMHIIYRVLSALVVVGAAWWILFIVLCVRCVVSMHVCAWFWSKEPRNERCRETTFYTALHRTLAFHAGSLAMLATWILLYAPKQLASRAYYLTFRRKGGRGAWNPGNDALAYQPGAVCQIALHGVALKRAARYQLHLKMRHGPLVDMCFDAARSVLVCGCLLTMGATVSCVAMLLHVSFLVAQDDLNNSLFPGLFAAAFAAAMFSAFVVAFTEAMETLVQCFCEDTERNDGSMGRPYYMPKSLLVLVLEKVQGRKTPTTEDADAFYAEKIKAEQSRRKEGRRERRRLATAEEERRRREEERAERGRNTCFGLC